MDWWMAGLHWNPTCSFVVGLLLVVQHVKFVVVAVFLVKHLLYLFRVE